MVEMKHKKVFSRITPAFFALRCGLEQAQLSTETHLYKPKAVGSEGEII